MAARTTNGRGERELARQHHLRAGDQIAAQINGETKRLTIGFLLRTPRTGANANPHFAAMDIGYAGTPRTARDSRLVSLRLTNGVIREKSRPDCGRVFLRYHRRGAGVAREQVEKMLAGFQQPQAMSLVAPRRNVPDLQHDRSLW